MNDQPVTGEVTPAESGFLKREAARQAKAQTSYLKKVHGRSKYVPHAGAREKARRLRQEQG